MNAPALIASFGFSALALLLLVVLALVLSSYVKIATVLSILRLGLGAGSLPAVLVTGGFALILSFFVMYPTLQATLFTMDRTLRASATVD
ncbi:MAG: hypothetical protein KDD69_04905, partial [Bdellovibrionales bacterium]|nr:hypothetical protein [Bdellovibrionales bacterium]